MHIIFDSLTQLTPTIHLLRLQKPTDFIYEPGQFITLVIIDDAGNRLYRSYSLSSHPDEDMVEITIKFPEQSRAQKFFNKCNLGDAIEFRGPLGRYVYHSNALEKIHIVTGAGIGPNYSMLKEHMLHNAHIPTVLFFGIQKKEFVPYQEQYALWKNQGNFNVYICTSKEDGDGRGSYSGRVLDVLEEQLPNLQNKEFYICGLPDMVRDTVEYLIASGVSSDYIYFEKFVAARV